MKRFNILRAVTAVALAATAAVGFTASASADPAPQTLTKPCSHQDVDCEGESSDDVPAGRWCSFDHDGDDVTPPLEGETDKHGRCVCATAPTTTTSTTVPETTTSTVPETTTSTTEPTPTTLPATTVPPTTEIPTTEEPPTTVTTAAPLTDTTVGADFAAAPTGARSLPRTGNDTGPMIAVGLALVAAGGVLVVATRRRLVGR
jgi:LPXTG-motif cell wall-anchored protein